MNAIGLDFYRLRDNLQKSRRIVFGEESPEGTAWLDGLRHTFRRRGWQIGSGPTESACKTTTHRIKGRGRRKDSANAEAMMALACLDDSRRWRTYRRTLTLPENLAAHHRTPQFPSCHARAGGLNYG